MKRSPGTFSLIIKFIGNGYSCSRCGRMRPSTHYRFMDNDEQQMASFKLCDECQDRGYEVVLTPRNPMQEKKSISDFERKQRLIKKRQVRLSRELETGYAEAIGGKTMPGSGNGPHAKADIRKMGQWRLEHKFTDSKAGLRVLVADLISVMEHANMFGEWPGLIVNFRKLGRSFVMIPYELFLWVVEILNADPTLDKRPRRRSKRFISKV